jgi:hypothetical protein
MSAPLGGVPGSGCETQGCAQGLSKGRSHRVDNGNVTHHESTRGDEHDVPSGHGSKGRGDNQRVWGADGDPRVRRGGRIVWRRRSGHGGQRRGVGDEYQGAGRGASQRGGGHSPAVGLAGGGEPVERKRKGCSAVV